MYVDLFEGEKGKRSGYVAGPREQTVRFDCESFFGTKAEGQVGAVVVF
jgi:hypothetical protein